MTNAFKGISFFYFCLTFSLIFIYMHFETQWMAQLPVHALLIPVIVSSCLIYFLQPSQLSWLKWGKIHKEDIVWMGVISIGASTALLLWAHWTASFGTVGDTMAALSQAPRWMVVAVLIPAFALLMPLAEESLYRGIVIQTVEKITGSWWIAAVVQAFIYALFHYFNGFPNGTLGFFMVFIYGIALALLRRRTKGLLAPYITHVMADLTIGYFLVFKFL